MPPRAVSTESKTLKRKRQNSALDNAATSTGVQFMNSVTVPERQPRGEIERNGSAGAFKDPIIYQLSAEAKRLVDLDGDEDSSEEDDFADDLDDFSTEDDDSDVEHKWLKPVRSTATAPDGVQIGTCTGNIVYRNSIRKDFHSQMEEPSDELAELAFSLFDRWGNVKSDYISHPVKKGTGVWGKELNQGSFFYIEKLHVHKDHYRQGFGRQMVEEVCKKARKVDPSCQYALTWPAFIDDRGLTDPMADAGGPEHLAHMADGQMGVESFWRSLGFRTIGTSLFLALALTGTHPSLTLSKTDDYVRPFALRADVLNPKATHPYDKDLLVANDDGTLRILQQRAREIPPNDARWFATDLHGRNLMHCVVASAKPKALAYLRTLQCASDLSLARDLQGDTPREGLERRLDENRTKENHGWAIATVSDEFRGHSAKDVACLAQLTGTSTTDSLQMDRLRFGCTCGECIAGFISPRTAYALSFQGGLKGDELGQMDCTMWCHINNFLLCHLPLDVQQKMKRSERMCEGFAAVFFHLSAVLKAKRAPTTANILQQAERERPALTKAYIEQGGTIAGPILVCFERAMAEDTYLGNSDEFDSLCGEEISELRECRNDHELEFVRRQLLRMEGLAVEYPNEGRYRFG